MLGGVQNLMYSGRRLKEFLEEGVGTAVDDLRHSDVVDVGKASVHDFKNQVQKRCPLTHPFPLKSSSGCN